MTVHHVNSFELEARDETYELWKIFIHQ